MGSNSLKSIFCKDITIVRECARGREGERRIIIAFVEAATRP
jgi:hypothetical protein